MDFFLDWIAKGIWDFSVPALICIIAVLTHITVLAVTIYLHRYSAHRALWLHPILQHFFRLWLWLGTGMNTKEWTAVHRKHHVHCETEEDPHSPVIQGINKILWDQAGAYRVAAVKAETLQRFGSGTPNDWLEHHLYKHTRLGVSIMFLIDLAVFGVIGITVWAIQMMWIPLVGGVINGIGHWWGYRNFECPDAARNIVPIGIIIGGEELHNNHHTYPNSAKLSVKKGEVDMGWLWICLFQMCGLARPLSTGPIAIRGEYRPLDNDTALALINDRFNVMATYASTVMAPLADKLKGAVSPDTAKLLSEEEQLLWRDASLLDESSREKLNTLVQDSELKTIYDLRLRLQSIWEQRSGELEEVVKSLGNWCAEAEATGEQALKDFVTEMKRYTMPALQPAA